MVYTIESVVSLNRSIIATEKSLNIQIAFSHVQNGQRNAETGSENWKEYVI